MLVNPEAMNVACVDGSPFTNAVCSYAAWASKRVGVGVKLLHTIDERPASGSDLSGSIGLGAREHLMEELVSLEEKRSRILLDEGKAMLARLSEQLVAAGNPKPILRQRRGTLQEALIDCEDEIRVLFMGIRGHEHKDQEKLLGQHLEGVARTLYKPIFVVNREFSAPSRIMLAFDGSEGSNKALQMLTDRPLLKGLPCHLVYVNPKNKIKNKVEEAGNRLQQSGYSVTAAELSGAPEEALCRYQQQENIDLTVMGAFSHTRIRDLLIGSFTVRMLLSTKQPLLLLR